MIRHDDRRTAGGNAIPITIIYFEMDIESFQQTLGKTESGSGPARLLEAIRQAEGNQQPP